MSYEYIEELDMYMDDDGHMLTEDMLPEDMQERLRMQRIDDIESRLAQEEAEADRRYYQKIRNAYLAGDKEGTIKFAEHEIHSQYEFVCGYSAKERKESIEAIKKAGELGHMPAIEYLIKIYHEGIQNCLEPDFEKLLYWIDKGIASDSPDFLCSLGDIYLDLCEKGYKSRCKDKVVQAYKKAIELGSVSALYKMYKYEINSYRPHGMLNGQIMYIAVPKMISKKAFEYLSKAAETGRYKYLNTLGLEYFKGRICEKDENAAFKCFEKVVDEYNKPNPFALRACVKSTDNDDDDENTYFTSSRFDDHVPAVYNLAYCYENGIGCEVNKEKAFKLYSSIKKLSRSANLKVAYCYENGVGCEVNKEKAFRMYKALAKDVTSYNEDDYIEKFLNWVITHQIVSR